MNKVKKVFLGENFMSLYTEDGVAGCLHIQRTSQEINPNKKEQIIIMDVQEAKEVVKLIQEGINFLSGEN